MAHQYPLAIFYEDTDAGGVVYHANYLKFMERARTTWLNDKGLSLPALIDTFGIQLVVHTAHIRYEHVARLQQQLMVVTEVAKLKRASLIFHQSIYLVPHQVRVCFGEIMVVCTNLQFKPCAIPQPVLRELKE